MIPGFEYGFPTCEGTVYCIRREGATRMLCGRRVGFVPVVQPEHPRTVHADCLKVMCVRGAEQQKPAKRDLGVCPVCRGEVPLSSGRVEAHGEWRRSAIGQRFQIDVPCLGINMVPLVRGGR